MGHNPIVAIFLFSFMGVLLWYLSRENKNKKEEYLRTGIGCLGFIGLILFIQFITKYDLKSLDDNKIETIGEIIGFGTKNSIKWKFQTKDGRFIEGRDNNDKFIGMQVGEFYKVSYDSTNVKNARIDLSKPVIRFPNKDTLYQYRFPHGKISNTNVYVTYEYLVGNKTYQRQQVLPREGNWEEIDSFMVILNKTNPRVSYFFPKK